MDDAFLMTVASGVVVIDGAALSQRFLETSSNFKEDPCAQQLIP